MFLLFRWGSFSNLTSLDYPGNCFQVSFSTLQAAGHISIIAPGQKWANLSSFRFFRNLWSEWSGEVASPQCGYTKASLCQIDRSWPPDLRWYPPKWTTNSNNLFSGKIHLLFHAPRCCKSYVGWKRGEVLFWSKMLKIGILLGWIHPLKGDQSLMKLWRAKNP